MKCCRNHGTQYNTKCQTDCFVANVVRDAGRGERWRERGRRKKTTKGKKPWEASDYKFCCLLHILGDTTNTATVESWLERRGSGTIPPDLCSSRSRQYANYPVGIGESLRATTPVVINLLGLLLYMLWSCVPEVGRSIVPSSSLLTKNLHHIFRQRLD